MLSWLTSQMQSLQSFLFLAASVACVLFLIHTYVKHRAIVPVILGALTAGVVLFAIHNTSWFETKVRQQTSAPAGPSWTPPPVSGRAVIVVSSGRV